MAPLRLSVEGRTDKLSVSVRPSFILRANETHNSTDTAIYICTFISNDDETISVA